MPEQKTDTKTDLKADIEICKQMQCELSFCPKLDQPGHLHKVRAEALSHLIEFAEGAAEMLEEVETIMFKDNTEIWDIGKGDQWMAGNGRPNIYPSPIEAFKARKESK